MTTRGHKDALGEPIRLTNNGMDGTVLARDSGAALDYDEGAVIARGATEVGLLAIVAPKIGLASGGTASTAIYSIPSFSASGVGNDDVRPSCRDSATIIGA